MDFLDFYKGKKVFLTGHTGFKGSWLLCWLHQLGAEVMGYALAPYYEDDIYHFVDGDRLCTSFIGDIRNYEQVNDQIQKFQPDIIFHLAAQPLVRLSYSQPLLTFDTNVMGTTHICESLNVLNQPCTAVIITTDKVYLNKELPNYYYQEQDALGGYDPYSASKAACEIVVQSYAQSFFSLEKFTQSKKSIVSARAGNVIGGGDRSLDRLIPDIIRGIQAEEPIELRNPNAIRPWQFVLEPLCGYLELGYIASVDYQKAFGSWNFGPEQDDIATVEEICRVMTQEMHAGTVILNPNVSKLHEAGTLQLDITKAKSALHWKPRLNTQQAVAWTAQWYQQKSDYYHYTCQQIDDYTSLLK